MWKDSGRREEGEGGEEWEESVNLKTTTSPFDSAHIWSNCLQISVN
jgi:hypothetical protein